MVKSIPVLHHDAGNPFVGVHSEKGPPRMALDIFREIFLLGLETVLLGIFHGGYSGISGTYFMVSGCFSSSDSVGNLTRVIRFSGNAAHLQFANIGA